MKKLYYKPAPYKIKGYSYEWLKKLIENGRKINEEEYLNSISNTIRENGKRTRDERE